MQDYISDDLEDSVNFVMDQRSSLDAAAVSETFWDCTVQMCCPCCAHRLSHISKKETRKISEFFKLMFLLWAIGPFWWQLWEFMHPAYQVGSAYEGGDAFLFAHGLLLDERAIIFSPDDISYVNSSETYVDYAVSGQCRTFSGCLYDGPVYPTDEGRYHRFGGSQHPIMLVAMFVASTGLTGFLIANHIFGKLDRELYRYFQDNQELAETLSIRRYNQDDYEVFWSFLKFWILSFLNCALTLPNGTKMVDGCLEAGGFFSLRHLISISYVFVGSFLSFLVLLALFILNIKCFDEEIGLQNVKFKSDVSDEEVGLQERVRKMTLGQEDDNGEFKKTTCISLFLDAIRKVVKGSGSKTPCTCLCGQYRCCFTVGLYLQCVLKLLSFLLFIVFVVSGLSGLMGIINGIIDDPLRNSGQLVWWFFDLCSYCMEKAATSDENLEQKPLTAANTQEYQPDHGVESERVVSEEIESLSVEKKESSQTPLTIHVQEHSGVELSCKDDNAITPVIADKEEAM